MDPGSYDDAEGFVAGRSLDEWTEALFPGATMRTTARFDPDSPYSRLIEARSRCLLESRPRMHCDQAAYLLRDLVCMMANLSAATPWKQVLLRGRCSQA